MHFMAESRLAGLGRASVPCVASSVEVTQDQLRVLEQFLAADLPVGAQTARGLSEWLMSAQGTAALAAQQPGV